MHDAFVGIFLLSIRVALDVPFHVCVSGAGIDLVLTSYSVKRLLN